MSNTKKGEDTPQDGLDSDVTEIVPVSKPESESDDTDTTQIVSVESPVTLTQPLPGTVIGVVGGKKDTAAVSERQPPVAAHETPAAASGDDEATKILFNVQSQIPVTEGEQKDTEPDDHSEDMSKSRDVGASEADGDQATEDDKTVFLTPASKSKDQHDFNPPVGWLVIVDGPGRGAVLDVHYGQNTIGRGEGCHIRLNFGDTQITRETHAFILYDELERTFFLRDAGKKNLVRVNKTPVMTPTQLNSHDLIQIGKTTCLFVPLCNDVFDWLGGEDDPATGPPEEDKSE